MITNIEGKAKKPNNNDNLKTIQVFYIKDLNNERELIHRTVVVNMDRFICATPANYSYGYGKENVVSTYPHKVVEYPYEIAQDEYVEVHFEGSSFFYMYKCDFEDAFGVEAPCNRVCPF